MPATPADDPGAAPESRDLLRELVDHVPAMLGYWGADLRCQFANRAYERWFGVVPETMIGKHVRELLGPMYELNLPYIEAALRGEPQQFERVVPDPAGGPPRHSIAAYIPDLVDGKVRGFFVLAIDVSPVKTAELALEKANAELRESEERFRLTFDEAPIGMALVALDGRFSRVNRVLCEIVGYSEPELTELTFQAITHPGDLEKDIAHAGRLLRGDIQRYQVEKRYLRKDGATVDVMVNVSVMRERDGTPRCFITQISDITVRRRLVEDQRFLAEVGATLASTLDYDEVLARIAELVVRELADFCVIDSSQDGGRRLEVACRDPAHGELCRRMKENGRDHPVPRAVLATKRPVLAHRPAPELQGLIPGTEVRSLVAVPLFARDALIGAIELISTTRAYGPADVRLAEELARRAALSIENAWLYAEARRATQARDEVLGVVAHDLRNPLYTILLRTATLKHIGAPASTAATAIERSATRMNRMIEDLLDLTRIEANRLSVEPIEIAPERLVAEAGAAQRLLASEASVELVVDLPADLPPVNADPDRMHRVLENLIGNAIKFTPAGGRIIVGAARGAGEVVFRVTDTGRGIAGADLPRVFDRFWQARRADRKGAGLGLPIARGIVEAHHGRIWAESAPGSGTTFYFALPVAATAATSAQR